MTGILNWIERAMIVIADLGETILYHPELNAVAAYVAALMVFVIAWRLLPIALRAVLPEDRTWEKLTRAGLTMLAAGWGAIQAAEAIARLAP